jgi:membrane protein
MKRDSSLAHQSETRGSAAAERGGGASSRRAETAPDPDDQRKPDDVTDLNKRSWKYIVKKTFREFSDDQCTDLAAALTYYAVLALFPALLAVVSLLGLFGQDQQGTDALMGVIRDLAPNAADTLQGVVTQLSSNSAAGFGLVVGILGALWSASGYVGAFGRAMNRVYEIDEGRPFYKLRPIVLVITLIAVLLAALVAVALVVSGPVAEAVGSAVGLGDTAVTIWNIVKWPVILAIVIVVIAILYYATPNVKQPKFRWISIGAAIAVVVWILASVGFGFYVANFASYNKTYGSLAGVIVFLLWLWITNLALLFGAEIDSEVERGRQLQAGIAAEETLQLPPRDTKASDKMAAKYEKELEEARALRESGTTEAPHPPDARPPS